MLQLESTKKYESHCVLGEGLYVKNGYAAWVDIKNNSIFLSNSDSYKKFKTKSTPSIVFNINKNAITFGSDKGICELDINSGIETCLVDKPKLLDKNYRSNDGLNFGNLYILSFMHNKNPEKFPGYIFLYIKDEWILVDDKVFIPNSFIEIEPNKLLISDSLKSKVWIYEFDIINHRLIKKNLWTELDINTSPDGGCMFGNLIMLSIWDGAKISVFNKNGDYLFSLDMPFIRPTNCKYDSENSLLWVTSATEGLTSFQQNQWPESGNTWVFSLS